MSIHSRHAKWALAVALIIAASTGADAQMRYARGQNVAPAFEGWERNPDGTISMVFGYLNQELRGGGRHSHRPEQPGRPRWRRSRAADAFLPPTTTVRLQGRRACRLGQESQGAVDAHLPRTHRCGEGMASARMGAEPRGDTRRTTAAACSRKATGLRPSPAAPPRRSRWAAPPP